MDLDLRRLGRPRNNCQILWAGGPPLEAGGDGRMVVRMANDYEGRDGTEHHNQPVRAPPFLESTQCGCCFVGMENTVSIYSINVMVCVEEDVDGSFLIFATRFSHLA
jgi:hypothetical protein